MMLRFSTLTPFMDPGTDKALAHPEFIYALVSKLQDFTSSFPDVLDVVVFDQLRADALAFRRLLTSVERRWVLDRFKNTTAQLNDWQRRCQYSSRTSAKFFSLAASMGETENAPIAYAICQRLIQLSLRLLEHPNYIPAIGADLGIVEDEPNFMPAA